MVAKLGRGANFGVLVKQATVTYADGVTVVDVCDLPESAYILQIFVDVTTAFAGGASQTMDIGMRDASGLDVDNFANDVDVSSAARATVTPLQHGRDLGGRPVAVVAQLSAADNTAGACNITVCYINLTHSHLH